MPDRAVSDQSKGWQEDTQSRGKFNRNVGFNKGSQGRGDLWGGFMARGGSFRVDKNRSISKWEDSGSTGKREEQKKVGVRLDQTLRC